MLPELDVVPLLPVERGELLDLLARLRPDDWDLPTECPAWTVKGIALHVLGDDLSLLSRQRDEAVDSLTLEAQRPDAPADRRAVMHQFNERWVDTAAFFGTTVIGELLALTGDLTARFYREVDPQASGEPVGLFGEDGPAPYWQMTAREYLERWVHQAQIRRAAGAPAIADPALVLPGCAVVVRALVRPLDRVEARPGATVVLRIEDAPAAWTFVRGDGGWSLVDGEADDPAARLTLSQAHAAAVGTRGLPADQVRAGLTVSGEPEVAGPFVDRLVRLVARTP